MSTWRTFRLHVVCERVSEKEMKYAGMLLAPYFIERRYGRRGGFALALILQALGDILCLVAIACKTVELFACGRLVMGTGKMCVRFV